MECQSLRVFQRLVHEKTGLNDPVFLSAREQQILNLRINEYGDKRVAEIIEVAGADSQYGSPAMFHLCMILHESTIRKLSMIKHMNEVKTGWVIPAHMKPEKAEWLKEYHGKHKEARDRILA